MLRKVNIEYRDLKLQTQVLVAVLAFKLHSSFNKELILDHFLVSGDIASIISGSYDISNNT